MVQRKRVIKKAMPKLKRNEVIIPATQLDAGKYQSYLQLINQRAAGRDCEIKSIIHCVEILNNIESAAEKDYKKLAGLMLLRFGYHKKHIIKFFKVSRQTLNNWQKCELSVMKRINNAK